MLTGCARMGVPDGGERDTTPPQLVSHYPALEALQVAADASITLKFSKYMDRNSVSQAAFISPPLSGTVKWRWRGRSVKITHTGSFAANRTTVVTLGAGVRDYLGNDMGEPFVLAFSTSDVLERGELLVEVTGLAGNDAAEVWLVDSIFTGMTPMHVLPVLADGRARRFSYLPEGDWQLVAVQDLNYDRHWNPFSERIGLPLRPVQIPDTTRVQLLHLQFIFPDTAIFSSVRQLNQQVLQLRGYFPDSLQQTLIELKSGSETELPRPQLLCADRFEAYLTLAQPLPDDSATVRLTCPHPLRDLVFRTTTFSDTVAPELIEFSPRGAQVLPGRELLITTDEPLQQAAEGSMRVIINHRDTLGITAVEGFAAGGVIQVERGWSWGDTCEVQLESGCLRDAVGNTLPDSLFSWRFAVPSHDTVGALDGEVTGLPAATPVLVELLSLEGKTIALSPATPGFGFKDIPTGEYLMRVFVDSDGNGRYSVGSIQPFSYAEPYLVVRDTFQVAPRWLVGGLQLDGKELLLE